MNAALFQENVIKNDLVHNDHELLQDLIERVERLETNAPEDRLSLGVMSGNMDTTMAALIIAVGAAAYDMEVDLFFTFWATASLRDPNKSVKKKGKEKLFGMMLPNGADELPLSKMQMGGFGPMMIRKVLAEHGAKSLEELFEDAAAADVKIHVCTMSMDFMGIKKEELIEYPHLDFCGVGTFIDLVTTSKNCWFM